ncbi:pseudouridylate synthase TRUB1-like [Lytechinus pictus]|uniref:pseudouridylate synthase TRUB1-like n=1 Tax=Lytechinus pictus TaxID=7653 RepID=UPI0030B9F191
MEQNILMQLSKLNGLFAVRKPMGITSAKVVGRVKAALLRDLKNAEKTEGLGGDGQAQNAQGGSYTQRADDQKWIKLPKMGHGGTLDMNATGVLVIGCGRGTKLLSSFLQGGKVYVAQGRLGKATDTMDASGKEVKTAKFDHVTKSGFEKSLETFLGDILQVPPVYSALKVDGKRMSDRAARGEDVLPKAARPVKVYDLQCLRFHPPDFEIEVHCGGGFYVRKLIHDIGKSLGTCAFMTGLCRTNQGCFQLDQHALPEEKWTLEDIVKALDEFHTMDPGVR